MSEGRIALREGGERLAELGLSGATVTIDGALASVSLTTNGNQRRRELLQLAVRCRPWEVLDQPDGGMPPPMS